MMPQGWAVGMVGHPPVFEGVFFEDDGKDV